MKERRSSTRPFVVKDSGERQEFVTGARRDIQVGKGRFDLIPPLPVRRLAMIYEAGALKYGEHNWKKGIPLSRYLDSAERHLNCLKMRRWVLKTPWFLLRLHHIMRSDNDRHFHDHPFDFTSFILRGGYVEYTPGNPLRVCLPGSIVNRRAEDLHYLKLIGDSAWTFVVTSPYYREWGFHTEDGWIKADQYDAYIASKEKVA